MNARIAALGNPGSDRLKLAQKTDRAVAITAATLRQLRGLPVPAGQAATLSAIYAKVDKVDGEGLRLSAALRAGDLAAARRAASNLDADAAAANAASNFFGLTVCGS